MFKTFAASMIAASAVAVTPANVEQLLAGLLEQFLGDNKLTEIQACATDAEKEVPAVEKAIKDLTSGDIAGAITELKQIVADAPTVLKDCKDMGDDISALEAWVKTINPADIEKNIKAEPVKVAEDVAKIQSDFKAQKFEDAGKDAAMLLEIALGPVHPAELKVTPQNIAEIVAGLIEGFVDENKLTEIQACEVDFEKVIPDFDKAIKDLKAKDIPAAIIDLKNLVGEVPAALKDCEDMSDDISALEAWVKTINVADIEKNVKANPMKVAQDAAKIEGDFKGEKWSDCGKDAADLLMIALGPVHPAELKGVTPANIEAVLAGMLTQFLGDNKLTEIQACAVDAEKEIPALEKAIKDLQSGDIAGAVTELKQIVADAPTVLKDCEDMSDDISALEAWVKTINVADIEKNIKANPIKVAKDAEKIQSDFKAQKFTEVGQDAADLVEIALGPVHPATFLF